MWWLDDIIVPLLLIVGVLCFLWIAGFRTRILTRKSDRTAESMYDNFADPPRRQQ